VGHAALERRLRKLERALEQKEQEFYDNHASQKLVTYLPNADRWPEFAELTWIKTGSEETGGTVAPFVPYDYQIDLIRRIHYGQNIQILKSRQIGVSETIVSYLLNRALTEPGFTAVVISKSQKDSSDLARRAKFMADSILGEDIKYVSENLQMLSWKGRGTIHFLPAVGKAGRSIPACSVLFLDEAAFIEGVEDIYQGAAPTLTKLGNKAKIIVNSTPDLESDWFGLRWTSKVPSDWYDYVEARDFKTIQAKLDAIPGKWSRVVLHYSMHPEYGKDPTWPARYREEIEYTMMQWNAEFELMFGSTDSSIYDRKLVNSHATGAFIDCGLMRRSYVMGIDPNGGKSDYWVSVILDVTSHPRQVVAMYRAQHKTSKYSLAKTKELIDYFRPMSILIEENSMGVVLAEALTDQNEGYQIDTIFTSQATKNALTDRILYMLEHDDLIYPDGVIPSELRAFRKDKNGKRGAAAGFNDDSVMALSFACALANMTPDIAGFLKAL
jgi:hypothetical protein